MDKQQTINIINSNVKQNGREEITGPVLNNVLLAMVEYSSEAVPVQDLGPIEEELDDHERRITSNTDNITNVNSRIDRLDENKIKIVGLYPDINNPTSQSEWNRRVYNYIINGTANQNVVLKDQLNAITSNFGIENPNWKFTQVNNNPMIDVRGHKTTFRGALGFEVNPENKVEVAPSYIRGLNNNMEWTITKRGDNTLPSMLYLPQGETLQTLATSVNGIKADINGNVTLESIDPYQLPIATASRLGGVRVGTGLTIGFDGVLSATPLSYELPTATSTIKGGIRIGNGLTSNIQGVTSLLPATPFMIGGVRPDNSTITVDENGTLTVIGGGSGGGYVLPTATTNRLGGIIVGSGLTVNASGVLSATGGGGSEYVLPTATNTVKGGVRVDNKTTRMNGELIESLLPKRETIRIALSALNTDLMTGDLNGLVADRPFKIIDFKTTAGVVPSGSPITTGIKKNNSVITNTLSIINANNYTSVATAQPTFSSDAFAVNDRLNFYLPTGGIGTTSTGQNLQAVLVIEYTD